MSKNSKRNRQTGTNNAFKQGIIDTGKKYVSGGRVYFAKVLKHRTAKDAQGNALPPIPSITAVRVV